MRTRSGFLALGAVVGLATGCSQEEARPADPSRTPGAAAAAKPVGRTAAGSQAGPHIEALRLRPEELLPQSTVRVDVRTVGLAPGLEPDFTWTIDGERVYTDGPSIELPRLAEGAEVRVRVSIALEDGDELSEEVSAPVANAPPKITRVEIIEVESSGWRAEVEVSDANGDPVEVDYTWSLNGLPTSQRGTDFDTRGLKRGDRVFVEVAAQDDSQARVSLRSGTIEIANSAPEITSVPSGLSEAGTFVYRIEAEDEDGDQDLRFVLEAGPSGMTLSSDGELRWKPEIRHAGKNRIVVSVLDGRGGQATQEFVLPVRFEESPGDAPPAAAD